MSKITIERKVEAMIGTGLCERMVDRSDLDAGIRNPLVLRWATMLLIMMVGDKVCAQTLAAPHARPNPSPPVIAALRDDDIDKALRLFASATDETTDVNKLSYAAGGIYRALTQLSPDERYDLLHDWTFVKSDPKRVRALNVLVPEIGPPREFARALAERPSADSFAIASIGELRGMFSSGWILVDSAHESGRLPALTEELRELTQAETAGASDLLALAVLRNERSAAEDIKAILEPRIATKEKDHRRDAALVSAALTHDDVTDLCEAITSRISDFSNVKSAVPHTWPKLRNYLRRLHAHVVLKNRLQDKSPDDVLYQRPGLWTTSTSPRLKTGSGSDIPIWLVYEDHVKRLTGPGEDILLLRYPLTGAFKLRCEVTQLETGFGGLTYGGMSFDANQSRFRISEALRPYSVQRVWPFVAPTSSRLFSRLDIQSDGESITFLSNLHPGWKTEVALCESCPWLGLLTIGRGRIVFRNIEMEGNPIIPREVALINEDLRGWSSRYNESTPPILEPFPFNPDEVIPNVVSPVWSIADGEVIGASDEDNTTRESHLGYMRPLLDGETLDFEFYADDESMVHPALGRVAFLLEPRGVRLHWMTDAGNEWTCIDSDNAITEPLNRKGPRTLPLKSDDWNTVRLSLSGETVSVWLNEEQVYERSVEEFHDRQFGFFRDKRTSKARIRNIRLSGDWPEKLSSEQIENLVAAE